MSNNVKNNNVVHPADALAAALSRAGGLLAMLGELYDADRQAFATGQSFIVHSISTANELIDEAGRALVELHETCDLQPAAASPTPQPVMPAVRVSAPPRPVVAAQAAPLPPPVKAKPQATIMSAVASLQEAALPREQLAKTYPSFLEKITKPQATETPSLELTASAAKTQQG